MATDGANNAADVDWYSHPFRCIKQGADMKILITNGDGIYSPGIAALARVASQHGSVRIVAPDVEQSSMGHAITHSRPLKYERTPIGDFEAYRVNGTPADCVALSAHNWDSVDVVLSGINPGPNLGNSCWHSGTLAAAVRLDDAATAGSHESRRARWARQRHPRDEAAC